MDSEEEQQQARKEMSGKKKKKMKVTMEYVTPSNGEMAPVVAYFPSGYDLLKKQQDEESPPEVQVYCHRTRPSRMEVAVRLPNCGVEFIGTSYSGEAATPQLCRYSLGILDKESKTLKIVPIAANKIFRLEPKIKEDGEEEEKIEVLTQEMKKERDRELTSLYGSKKNKKYVKKTLSLLQQAKDLDAQEFLKNEMENVEINTVTETTRQVFHNIPPYDLTASIPEKAYLLDKIIPKAEWSHLNDILQSLESEETDFSNKKLEEMGYPTFVSSRIGKLQEIKDHEEKSKSARILLYITHLVNFLKMSLDKSKFRSKVRAGTTSEYIPPVIFRRFISLFVDPVSHAISADKMELLIGYVLVLTLFADNFRTLPHDIAKDLKRNHTSLRPFFKKLGCTFTVVEGKSCVVLEVPLKLPDAVLIRKQQKRSR